MKATKRHVDHQIFLIFLLLVQKCHGVIFTRTYGTYIRYYKDDSSDLKRFI